MSATTTDQEDQHVPAFPATGIFELERPVADVPSLYHGWFIKFASPVDPNRRGEIPVLRGEACYLMSIRGPQFTRIQSFGLSANPQLYHLGVFVDRAVDGRPIYGFDPAPESAEWRPPFASRSADLDRSEPDNWRTTYEQ